MAANRGVAGLGARRGAGGARGPVLDADAVAVTVAFADAHGDGTGLVCRARRAGDRPGSGTT